MSAVLAAVQVHLHKAKSSGPENLMAVCPFHRKADGSEERDPSFAININSGLWYCHSCHARGNLFTFLRDVGVPRGEIEVFYKEALDDASRHMPPLSAPLEPREAVKEPLPERILGLFDYCPKNLLDEGYPEDLLRAFDIGFDKVHLRITFPLRDYTGRLVGINGRTVVNAHPRYKIYSERDFVELGIEPRLAPERRSLLWNVHSVLIARGFVPPSERFCVITEGHKATMRVRQAGISNVVGLLGSGITREQAWLLQKLGCPLYLMLDNNEPGRRGTVRAGAALKGCPWLYVMEYDGPQPSEIPLEAIVDSFFSATRYFNWHDKHAAKYIT